MVIVSRFAFDITELDPILMVIVSCFAFDITELDEFLCFGIGSAEESKVDQEQGNCDFGNHYFGSVD